MKPGKDFIYSIGAFTVILSLLLLISCDDENQKSDLNGKLKSISIYLSKTERYTLDFNYETPYRTSIDITETYEDYTGKINVIKIKVILEYDDSIRITSEQLAESDYITNKTYKYRDNIIIFEILSGDYFYTDTMKLDELGRVIRLENVNYKWENNNLISKISDPVTGTYWVQSNTGTMALHCTYTPMSRTYKYDNRINPFASMNLTVISFLFNMFDDYDHIEPSFSPSDNNIIEANGTDEYFDSGSYTEHVRTYTYSVTYDITYDLLGYPIKMIINPDWLSEDQPAPEIHFKYFHESPPLPSE
jgi:hypothetical protein